MGLIPIYVFEEGNELPETGNYFVIAKNGVFMHKDAGLVSGMVRVSMEDLPCLGTLRTTVTLNMPPLPGKLLFKALTFFRSVWYKYRAEAAVLLFYNQEKEEYFVHCPRQEVSRASVSYGVSGGVQDQEEFEFASEMRVKGYKSVGTIHSHCNFSAYHSGTDVNDESTFDGLHITLGHVDRKTPSVASSVVVNNNRFQVNPTTVVSDIKFSKENFYKFLLYEDVEINQIQDEIETEWMPKVKQKQFFFKSKRGWFGGMFSSSGENSPVNKGYLEEYNVEPADCFPLDEDVYSVTTQEVIDGETKIESEGGGVRGDRVGGDERSPESDDLSKEVRLPGTDAD